MFKSICWLSAIAAAFAFAGCSPTAETAGTGTADHGHDHDHDHDHGHGHDHGHSHADAGPNGGHVVELGDEQYHVEWLHDDESGLVTMHILDADMAEEVPVTAESIQVEIKTDQGSQEFELLAVDGEGGKSSKFELNSPPLIEALKAAGDAVEASVMVPIGEETLTGKLEHDHGDEHGHAH